MNALVVRARSGDKEALAELWGAVSKFIHMKAVGYAKSNIAGTVTVEDLEQSGFFAVYDAARVYDKTRRTSFLTVLKYYLQKRFAEEAGVRTSRRDGLQYARQHRAGVVLERRQHDHSGHVGGRKRRLRA